MQFDFYLKAPILRVSTNNTRKSYPMSTSFSLPAPSSRPATSLNLVERAGQFVARLFSGSAVDTSDVWRLYRVAGAADSVSPAAIKALAAAGAR
jgi:hypothetical protein